MTETQKQIFDLMNFKLNHSPNSTTSENVPLNMIDYHIEISIPFSSGQYHLGNTSIQIACLHIYSDRIQIGID